MDDLRVHKRAVQAFKKEVEGLLTGQEVKALREVLGLTQADAARMFGGGPVAFSKYESDDVMQSEAMDKLLRVAAHIPSAVNFLHDLAGLSPVRQIGPWEPVVIERQHRVESVLSEEVLSENEPQPWRDVG
jgi:HTH-type transcriptional regulator/antitoxin MqsA